MTRHDRRRLLSPVLADEPLVGENLMRRLRIVLVALAIAFVLTNVTSYFLGQTFSANAREDAGRDTGRRVAELERKFNADLAERKAERDRQDAAQAAKVEQLRRDICVVLDRVEPRDSAVQAARRRYGCTVTPKPAASAGGTSGAGSPSGGGSASGGGSTPAGGTQAGGGPGGAPGPAGPPGPTGPPGASPSPTTPPPDDPQDGAVCLPLLGCVL